METKLEENVATSPPKESETWAIVELMGHVRLAGRLSEEEKFGSKLGRLDIPAGDKPCPKCSSDPEVANPPNDPCGTCSGKGSIPCFVTQYFGGGSVYRITLCTEAVARHVSKSTSPAPVSQWDFPKQLPHQAPPESSDDDFGDDLDDDPDHEEVDF